MTTGFLAGVFTGIVVMLALIRLGEFLDNAEPGIIPDDPVD